MQGDSPVRVWRMGRGLLQKDVAADMGISPAAYSQKENGKLGWSVSDLRYFRDHCGLTADYVLGLNAKDGEEVLSHAC